MDVPSMTCPCGQKLTSKSIRYTQRIPRYLDEPGVRIEYRCPNCRHLRDTMMLLADYRKLRDYWKSEVIPEERERISNLGAISFAEQRVMHEKLLSGNPLSELDY